MYSCKILADSTGLGGNNQRLTTFEITFPRIILAEFNTHRMLSRNAASSRAIPVRRRIEEINNHPYMPEVWGSNQAGMQASDEIVDTEKARNAWLQARNEAVKAARALVHLNVHKQLVNRLLEPFSWVTVVVSATDWGNFFHLRTHPDAQPEFQTIARMMRDMYINHASDMLRPDEWHLPYVTQEDLDEQKNDYTTLARISAARCARVSYLTHDGVRDREKDLQLATRLHTAGHMSPFEHPAMALPVPAQWGNFTGFKQYRKLLKNEHDPLGYQ